MIGSSGSIAGVYTSTLASASTYISDITGSGICIGG